MPWVSTKIIRLNFTFIYKELFNSKERFKKTGRWCLSHTRSLSEKNK